MRDLSSAWLWCLKTLALLSEGGALGAFVVFCIAMIKGMRWGQLKEALIESAKLSVMIFTIIWGVLIYVRFLGFADLPTAFADWITSLEYSPLLILVCILLAYAVLGMFMDAIGMLLLTLPVVYPAVMALNGGETVSVADSTFGLSGAECAIWFGIDVFKGASPFFVADALTIAGLVAFPGIVLYLPRLLLGS